MPSTNHPAARSDVIPFWRRRAVRRIVYLINRTLSKNDCRKFRRISNVFIAAYYSHSYNGSCVHVVKLANHAINRFLLLLLRRKCLGHKGLDYSVGNSTNQSPDFRALAHGRGVGWGGAAAGKPPSTKHNL